MMLILRLRFALRSLRHHKMRSLLTTLGIIIGVVAIIAVMSIGEGAKYKVRKEIEKMGSNFIVTLAASPKTLTQRGTMYFTLKPTDVQAIRDECSEVSLISPAVQYQGNIITEGANWQTTIGGTNEVYLEIRQLKMARGDFFTEQDIRSASKTVVLGLTVAKELFGDKDPVGAIVRIKKIPFKVIGVIAEQGRAPDGRDLDDGVFVPITTALRKLLGKTSYNALIMSTHHKEQMSCATRQIRAILRQKHRLQERDEDDFTIFSQDDAFQASEAASAILNLLLVIIASISLMVGGIGIMNIMLVTVSERTKEIGIRMALGATTSSILTQFILESVAICLIGGLLGVFLGITTAKIVGLILGWPIFISQKSIAISLVSASLTGLFFGYYPAKKASRMNPVDALIEN
jgi:putative ABC transport system permease protein